MFTIQYQAVSGEHKTQTFDSQSRTRLVSHLAQFEHPIMAVYEQASPITKAIRKALAEWPGAKSRAALDFIKSPA
jgi:hypothetical protein